MDTRAQLVALLNSKVLTGGRRTTAQNIRDFENSIITSVINFIDDRDANGGYLGIDSNGRVDISFITAATPAGDFLRDDGTWASVLTSVAGLPAVLAIDNTSGGSPINMLDDDEIQWGNSRTNVMKYNLLSGRFQLVNITSTDYLYLHDAGGMDLYSASILKLDAPAIHVTGGVQSTGGLTGLQVHSNTNAILYATDGFFPSALILSGPGNNAELSTSQNSISIEKAYFGTTSTTATMSAISQSASQTTEISVKPDQAYVGSTYATFAGLEYSGDYSANYTIRSLIDKGYASSTYLALAGGTMTGALILYTNTPATSLEAASKGYVDSLIEGLDWKEQVITASTANETLSGVQSVGGVVVGAGRVLLKDQTDQTENGIWDVNSLGAWTRSLDASTGTELEYAVVEVNQGINAGKVYRCNTYPITLGVTNITWAEWNVASYLAGTGLLLTGTTFSIDSTVATLTGVQTFTNKVSYNGLVITANTGAITTGTWTASSISTTYTDAKIKGSVTATAGLIPYGTGTADTVTTSSGNATLSFDGIRTLSVRNASTGNNYGGVFLLGNDTASNTLVFYVHSSTYAGNWTGSSVPFANLGLMQAGSNAVGTYANAATVVYNLIGSTGTNISTRLSSTGLKIDTLANIHTASGFALQVGQTSSASVNETARFTLVAGGTDAETYVTSQMYNAAAGTGTDLKLATSFSNPTANAVFNGFAHATTTGYNVGGYYEALGGNLNVGLIGKAITNKSNATNIGVMGIANQATGTPIRIGGYFGLGGSDTPTFTGLSAGIVVSNGAIAAPIAIFRDNTTTVWSIADGGILTAAEASDMSFGTTTGSKLGLTALEKIGKWGVAPVVQPAHANQAALTDGTTGTASFSLVDSAGGASAINDNFASVARLLNQIRSDLVSTGEIKGSA